MTARGFRVTARIDGAHPILSDYPLLPGDLLTRESSGTWMKEAPGLAVGGFSLTVKQLESLEQVDFSRAGLAYTVIPPAGEIA